MPTTPYMGLALPIQGSSVPDWSGLLNTAFSLLDSHDHSAGHGVPIPSAAININADLPFNGFNLTQARTLRLQQQAAAPSLAPDAGCLYLTTAGDLWWNNSAGQHIQITSGAALAASSLGGISGLGGTSAGAAYSNSTKTFTLTQAANQSALLDAGPLIIHDTAASAFGITLQSPVGIAGAYALTLPAALPATTSVLTISATGQIAAGPASSGLAQTPKAWANITIGASGAVTVNKGNNVASASYSGTSLTVTYTTAMADATGAINPHAINVISSYLMVQSQSTTACVLGMNTLSGGGGLQLISNYVGVVMTVVVFD